jgi:exonuclease III
MINSVNQQTSQSYITLSVNGFNSPIKRYKLLHWIKKQDAAHMIKKKQEATNCCLKETHVTTKETHKLKIKGYKKIYQACENQKQAGIAIFISDKADFTQKSVRKDKDHYVLIKGTIKQEDITILNIYAPKTVSTNSLNKHF